MLASMAAWAFVRMGLAPRWFIQCAGGLSALCILANAAECHRVAAPLRWIVASLLGLLMLGTVMI